MTVSSSTIEILKAALSRVDVADENQRLGVYKAAFKAADKLPADSRSRYKEQLGTAVLELERGFGTPLPDNHAETREPVARTLGTDHLAHNPDNDLMSGRMPHPEQQNINSHTNTFAQHNGFQAVADEITVVDHKDLRQQSDDWLLEDRPVSNSHGGGRLPSTPVVFAIVIGLLIAAGLTIWFFV